MVNSMFRDGTSVLPLTARRYVLVSVTRRKHRAGPGSSGRNCPCASLPAVRQGGYGAVFAI